MINSRNRKTQTSLPELSRTMAYTKRNTAVNTLARNELNLNPVVLKKMKGGINPYIELQEHNLDQIAARNITIPLDKFIAFSR